jgi:hypothetical protein
MASWEPDLDGLLAALGTERFYEPTEFVARGDGLGVPGHWLRKAIRIGAVEEKALGPRGGARCRIVSAAAWDLLKQWRGALALGARKMRDDDLKLG